MSLKVARKDVVWCVPGLEKFLLENGCVKPYEVSLLEHSFIVSWVNVEPSFYIFWVVSKGVKSSTVFEIRNEVATPNIFDCDEEAIEYLKKIKQIGYDFDREQYRTMYNYVAKRCCINLKRKLRNENPVIDLTKETVDLTEDEEKPDFLEEIRALDEMDDFTKLKALIHLARIEHELVGYLLDGKNKPCVRLALDQLSKICRVFSSNT